MYSPLSQGQSVSVASAQSTFVAGTNPKRRSITVFSPTANRVTLSFGGTAVLDSGPTIQPGSQPVTFDADEYGELIQRQISAIAATAPTQLTYSETFDA